MSNVSSTVTPLADVLAVQAHRDRDLSERGRAELDAALVDLLDRCRRAWTGVEVTPSAFLGHLAAQLPATVPLLEAVRSLSGEELYLAFACSIGDRSAVETLESHYGSHILAVLDGFNPAAGSRDDLRQIVRRKLFVAGETAPAAIARYSGQGSLAAWLRVTVKRTLLNATRRRDLQVDAVPDDDLFGFPQSLGDPELDYLKEAYRAAFRDAFLDAVGQLSRRERTLLRQSVVNNLTVRQLGRMYRVHHGTAARWVAQARENLVAATRNALLSRLEVSQSELQSIMALIESRLDVSVARVLR